MSKRHLHPRSRWLRPKDVREALQSDACPSRPAAGKGHATAWAYLPHAAWEQAVRRRVRHGLEAEMIEHALRERPRWNTEQRSPETEEVLSHEQRQHDQ